MDLSIHPLGQIDAELRMPGDKSISHRAALVAAMADGTSCLRNFADNEDCRSTLRALSALGVSFEELEPGTVTIVGRSGEFSAPAAPIDCGNSGTTARLLAGLLAGQEFESVLMGDESLSKRPMERIAGPLRTMGGEVTTSGAGKHLPIHIRGGELTGCSFVPAIASAQVKGTILFAGLRAKGVTSVTERLATRDHTERIFHMAGVAVEKDGSTVSIAGGQAVQSLDFTIPGDISSAAFWMALAAGREDSRIILRDVGLDRTRLGFVDALLRMGAGIREEVLHCGDGEWYGHLDVRGGSLRPIHIRRKDVPALVDEIPILSVLAALANGTSTIRGASELRSKECDRISAIVTNLRRMKVEVEEYPDGLAISGRGRLAGGEIDSFGDHRIAMAFAIGGALADEPVTILGAECMAISYPGFGKDLERVGQTLSMANCDENFAIT